MKKAFIGNPKEEKEREALHKKGSGTSLAQIIDRIDDDLDYFYALFDVMARASEKSDPSTIVSIEVLSKDASRRVVNLKNLLEDKFIESEGLKAD